MRKIVNYLIGLFAVFSLGSCLKDKGFNSGLYGINGADKGAIITMSAAQSPLTAVAVNFVSTSQTTLLTGIAYDADQPTGKDIKVTTTIAPDMAALITAWNTANPGSPLTALPTSVYTIPNPVVTIAAGTRIADLKITIPNATLLDVSTTYGLAITIASNDGGIGISSNLKTALFAVSAKNKYDGVYRLTLSLSGWSAYGIGDGVSGVFPPDIHLITAGATSLTLNAPNSATAQGTGLLQPGWTGGIGSITGYTAFGATTPKYTFDGSNDKLTAVVNTTPDDGRGRTLFLDPAITTSRYDPSTKTIYASYVMTQNGRPNQFIGCVFTYLRAR